MDESTDTGIELYVFADTSKVAHGVTCYIRFKVNNKPKLLRQNPTLRLPIKNHNRFQNLNYKPP